MPETLLSEAAVAAATRHFETPGGTAELRRAPQGFWQSWPRPTADELAELYGEDYYASDKPAYFEKTERESAYWDVVWDLRRHVLEQHLPVDLHSILDVGCAGGFLLKRFRDAGWRVDGVEPSRRAIDYAREKFGLELFCGPVEQYETDAPFGAIHASQVLEHLLDPADCLRRMASLLAPGGLVFLEVPNEFNALQTTVAEELGKPPWWIVPRHHLNYFDFDSLAALCEGTGLEVVDRLGTFPMELFALMGKDYVGDGVVGAEVHAMRMQLERHLCAAGREDVLIEMQRGFARQGLGRTACVVARKAS